MTCAVCLAAGIHRTPILRAALQLPSKKSSFGTCPVVQWLRVYASTAGVKGSILGKGTKIPHAERCCKKKNLSYPSLISCCLNDKDPSQFHRQITQIWPIIDVLFLEFMSDSEWHVTSLGPARHSGPLAGTSWKEMLLPTKLGPGGCEAGPW